MKGEELMCRLNLWRKRQPIYTGVRGSLAGMLAEHEPPLCLKSNTPPQLVDLPVHHRKSVHPEQACPPAPTLCTYQLSIPSLPLSCHLCSSALSKIQLI